MLVVRDTRGASLVEFAVSLPLLVVLVVGIFDFGGAFNLKQELSNAMREGARFEAAQPTNDLCSSCTAPPSVDAARYVIDAYLIAARINDCGLAGLSASQSSSGPPWVYTSSGTCTGSVILTIARDPSQGSGTPTCSLPASNYGSNGVNVYLLCANVSISYPYQWHFNNVIQLISPGTSLGLTNLQTAAAAENME